MVPCNVRILGKGTEAGKSAKASRGKDLSQVPCAFDKKHGVTMAPR